MPDWRLSSVWLLLFLGACASREVLIPWPAAPPAGVELGGQWQLAGDAEQIRRRLSEAIRRTDGLPDRLVLEPAPRTERRLGGRRDDGRARGGLVHVFFEDGENLKITQTRDGLFVSFDRAVVEEYRYGENREVSVGQAKAQRVSGWDGSDYVIESLDRSGMKLTERYQLGDSGDTLIRPITFRASDGESVTVIQRFRRQPGGA